ncbi:MAG TPA: SAM-dependent methyltransferase, partial [Blastocatellia bacterium]|nr:SAM-dependent methyltransferase [Blastocatellia bacterium]
AIKEMCRVAQEVRIFPILDLKVRKSAHIESLLPRLEESALTVEIVRVPYEFQRGGDEMMKIRKQ